MHGSTKLKFSRESVQFLNGDFPKNVRRWYLWLRTDVTCWCRCLLRYGKVLRPVMITLKKKPNQTRFKTHHLHVKVKWVKSSRYGSCRNCKRQIMLSWLRYCGMDCLPEETLRRSGESGYSCHAAPRAWGPPIPEMEKYKPQQNKYWGTGCDNNYKNSKNNYVIETNNGNKCNEIWIVYETLNTIHNEFTKGYIYIQGPPKKCIHTLTKENSTLYNRLL